MVNKAAAETPETDASGQTATASEVNMSRKLVAENEIKDYVIASVAAGIVPVPAFDIAAVIAIQLRMIQRLSELYGKPFSDNAARNTLSALASLPVVSGASTYAIGRSIIKHYEGGGSLFDISASDLSSYYKEQFEKGKQLAAEAKLRKAAA